VRFLPALLIQRHVDPPTAATGLIPNGLTVPYEDNFIVYLVLSFLKDNETFVGGLLLCERNGFSLAIYRGVFMKLINWSGIKLYFLF